MNMVVKVIEYYTKYQNNYVKHDDNVNEIEIEQTRIIMKFLIKMLG